MLRIPCIRPGAKEVSNHVLEYIHLCTSIMQPIL